MVELDGKDLRKHPMEERKRLLAKLLRDLHPGIAFNQHYDGDWREPRGALFIVAAV